MLLQSRLPTTSIRQRRGLQLAAHYPWDSQPRGGVEPSIAISAISGRYRNPLVHALAVSTRKSGRGPARRIVVDTAEKPLGVIKQALTEEAVVALERRDGPAPNWLTPVITSNSGGGVDLYPHSLYLGERAERWRVSSAIER